MRNILWMGVAVGVLLSSVAAGAHHGDADRYNQEVVTVTGTVVECRWSIPHAHIVFDVEEGGKTVRWQAELGAPQQVDQAVRLDAVDDQEGDEAHDDRAAVEERRSRT